MDQFCDLLLVGLRPVQRARPGKFFWQLERADAAALPPYATQLLRSIVSSQSWGIPSVGRRAASRSFFKGGWRGTTAASSCTRRRSSATAAIGFSLARADRRQPVDGYGIGRSRASPAGSCAQPATCQASRPAGRFPRCWLRGSRRWARTPFAVASTEGRRFETPPTSAALALLARRRTAMPTPASARSHAVASRMMDAINSARAQHGFAAGALAAPRSVIRQRAAS